MSDIAAQPTPNLLANGWVKGGLIVVGLLGLFPSLAG